MPLLNGYVAAWGAFNKTTQMFYRISCVVNKLYGNHSGKWSASSNAGVVQKQPFCCYKEERK
jgi:hypothetical protein